MSTIACPGCRQTMQPVDLDRQFSGAVTVDLCGQCKALRFDAFESVQLSAAGTLQLFRAIHDTAATADLDKLKKLVRIIRCSSCGALVDLETQTAYSYCRAPIAILDPDPVACISRARCSNGP